MKTSKYYKKLKELTSTKSLVGSTIVEIVDADDAEVLVEEIISDYEDLINGLEIKIQEYENILHRINQLLP